jgi:anti-sigma B factor antagonist
MRADAARIATSTVGPVTLVRLSGELDLAVAVDLERAMTADGSEQCRVVYVDLSEATFIDASVLGVLVRSGRCLSVRGSRLQVFGASGMVARVLALTRIAVEYGAVVQVPDAVVAPGGGRWGVICRPGLRVGGRGNVSGSGWAAAGRCWRRLR